MSGKILAAAGIVVALALITTAGWTVCQKGSPRSSGSDSIVIGNMLYEYSGLLFIAEDRDFFAGNGLNVTLHDYTSSVESIKGLEAGETDITLVPEYSIVTEAFGGENLSIVGNIDKYQSVFLICRRDRGIYQVNDLNGKTIGVSRGTIGEFYLGRFLELRGVAKEDVKLAYIPTTQYIEAIGNGTVDAVVVVYKYVDQGREILGDDLAVWPIQSGQKGFVVLVCRKEWAEGHQETINRLLESIGQAEGYAASAPLDAQSIVGRRMNYTDATMNAIRPDHQYSLTLDQSLVTAMEDEARWMIANNLTNTTSIPDFRDYIDASGMEAVRHGSVNII